MNILEQLSNNNKENYKSYLDIMSDSINRSSKGLIPLYAKKCKRILDVGCGSGILIQTISNLNPSAYIHGIDLNSNALDICNKKFSSNININFTKAKIEDLFLYDEGFDCIIFSSVLHEISSYSDDPNLPKYTDKPIISAINAAYNLLNKRGKLIIRDGIKSYDDDKVKFRFVDEKMGNYYFHRFKNEYHTTTNSFLINGENVYGGKFKDIKEFLYTYTWSEESWDREVQEQFGILSINEWIDIVNKRFAIKSLSINSDDYVKYLREKITVDDVLEKLLSDMTILIVAEKL